MPRVPPRCWRRQASNPSRRRWSRGSPERHASGSGSMAVAISPRPSPRARPARRGRRSRGPHHRLEKQPASDTDRRSRRKAGYTRRSQFCSEVAERVGFEPTVPVKAQRFSRPPRSTTLAPLPMAGLIGGYRDRSNIGKICFFAILYQLT